MPCSPTGPISKLSRAVHPVPMPLPSDTRMSMAIPFKFSQPIGHDMGNEQVT